MCQECAKLSLGQRVATLKNLKYKIYFLVSAWFHMCDFIVLMSSLLFYNVENSKDKEKPWNVKVSTFDRYCVCIIITMIQTIMLIEATIYLQY